MGVLFFCDAGKKGVRFWRARRLKYMEKQRGGRRGGTVSGYNKDLARWFERKPGPSCTPPMECGKEQRVLFLEMSAIVKGFLKA